MSAVLGLVEHESGRVGDRSLEMLTLGRGLAAVLGAPLRAVLVGSGARPAAAGLARYGVTSACVLEHPRLTGYAPAAWARALAGIIEAERPQAVLAAATDCGNEIMAHVAARLDLPLAANCTEVHPGEPYRVVRLRWGGSLLEEALLPGAVKLMTIAPHALDAEAIGAGSDGFKLDEVEPVIEDADLRVRVTGRTEALRGGVSLADARVVVAGGQGVGSAEAFKELEELAELLGAAVGCSRVATSMGWRPHADQVGLTGTRIAPDLYIACGISGAFQHLVGCKGAKRILAINTDPHAPMVSKADYAVIGDLHEVIPALTAEIRNIRG